MSTSNEKAMRLALEAVDKAYDELAHAIRDKTSYGDAYVEIGMAHHYLKQALAKQTSVSEVEQGEPVAKYIGEDWSGSLVSLYDDIPLNTLLYTTPYVPEGRQQRTAAEGEDTRRAWVGLTGEEIYEFWPKDLTLFQFQDIAQAIEAKLKEKNG